MSRDSGGGFHEGGLSPRFRPGAGAGADGGAVPNARPAGAGGACEARATLDVTGSAAIAAAISSISRRVGFFIRASYSSLAESSLVQRNDAPKTFRC